MASPESSRSVGRSGRLDRSVVPDRYELSLAPDLERATFEGSEEISIEIRRRSEAVVLNAVELQIRSAWLTDGGGRRIAVSAIEADETREEARLALAQAVEAGPYRLHIDFAGSLNDKLRGFYRSRYEDADGRTRVIAATQFESTEARRAFPCFDEPDLKAVFAVTLVVDPELLAVSNGPIVSETLDEGGVRRVRFADTMRMSTYLVAFVVGPLEASEAVEIDGIPIRIVHPIGQGRLTRYALEVARFSLQFFARYYAIAYPGDKLDLIALPDFAMGAMENLGCVTFRETLLLVDPETVTQGELKRSAEVVAHELAHMWFGDLVTMRWWNGIWLNEAFATFMAMKALEAYRPEWHPWVEFSLGRSAAFEVDALSSSRPIEYPVESPADAEGMFDVLTYQKGAAVLRMLERYLGEESFRNGIRAYLAKHSYGNTETQDLWAALQEASKEPVERIMTTWIFQLGFPRVRVARAPAQASAHPEGELGALRFAQERFLLGRLSEPHGRSKASGAPGARATTESDGRQASSPSARREEASPRWAVPLLLRLASAAGTTTQRALLDGPQLDLRLSEPARYVVVNSEATGYYRVSYDEELFRELTGRLFEALAPVERFALLDDAWAMVLAGEQSAGAFLALAATFAPETDVDVWKALVGALGHLSRLVDGEPLRALRETLARLLRSPLERAGWEPRPGEPLRDHELRGLLVETLCVIGLDEPALLRARGLYDRSLIDPSAVEPNLAAAALAAVAATGNAGDYERFVARSKRAPTPQERLRYLYSLASFPGGEELERTLAMTLDGEVRTQNAPFLLGAAMRNRYHGERAWSFIRDNWEAITAAFPSNTIVRMLAGLRALSRRAIASEVEAFFAEHPVPQGQLTLRQHLDLMMVNVALREREEQRLAAELLRGRA